MSQRKTGPLPTLPPVPLRPRTGWAAWEATVGHMTTAHSPDVLLLLRAAPHAGGEVSWQAGLVWALHHELGDEQPTPAEALRLLWHVVARVHQPYITPDDPRRPEGYADAQWLDADTREALDRLVYVARVVFGADWLMLATYQAASHSQRRVQMRLVARGDVCVNGCGPTLHETCARLYRNATPHFAGARR